MSLALMSGVFVGSALATALLVPLATRYARRKQLIDQPDVRRSHHLPVPRGGGIAMLVVVVATIVILTTMNQLESTAGLTGAIGISMVGLVGWWDDHQPLSPWLRLITHFIAAILVVSVLPDAGYPGLPDWCWKGLLVISAVWVTNLYNFMDGTDAMAAGEGLFWGLAACIFFLLAGAESGSGALASGVAGVCLGFLVYNRPPATVFMGDVGSGCLGFTIAWLLVRTASTDPALAMVLVCLLGLFLVDATATLLMRMWRGDRWYNPHRDHAYQTLVRLGRTHADVVVLFTLANVLWVLPTAFLLNAASGAWRSAIAAMSLGALLVCWWRIQRRFSPQA